MATFDPGIYLGPQSTPGYFGMESLNRARAAGYSDAEIDASVKAAGYQYGGEAANSINVSSGTSYTPTPSPTPSSSSTAYFDPNMYLGPQSTPGYFGMESLNRAKADGYTDEQINSSINAAGFQYGEQAAAVMQPTYTNYNTSTVTAPKPPTTQGTTSSEMPQKTGSAAPPQAPVMDYSQVYAPPSPRDDTNLYEDTNPGAGGDRNSESSELDYTWQWEDMQSGTAQDSQAKTVSTGSSDNEDDSFSDSWRKYTASGQPLAGSIFGG